MYLRFVLPATHPDTGVESGVFDIAYTLKNEGEISEAEKQELMGLLTRFGAELAVPDRFSRSTSKRRYRRATKGICWLKASAHEHVKRMHRLAQILREHGYHVEMIRSASPGYVVYQDDHQIVAEPFNDMLKRL